MTRGCLDGLRWPPGLWGSISSKIDGLVSSGCGGCHCWCVRQNANNFNKHRKNRQFDHQTTFILISLILFHSRNTMIVIISKYLYWTPSFFTWSFARIMLHASWFGLPFSSPKNLHTSHGLQQRCCTDHQSQTFNRCGGQNCTWGWNHDRKIDCK